MAAASRKNQFKVVLLGEGCVGKTSLMLRYVQDKFNDKHLTTLQASFLNKRLNIDNQRVNIAIWDTAGQERFHALGPIYYRDSNGAILVYDITDEDSFFKVKNWVKELKKMLGEDIALCIAGNKIDLEKDRHVDASEADAYAKTVGAKHFHTSAKLNKGIEEMFFELSKQMLERQGRSDAKVSRDGMADRGNNRRKNVVIVDEQPAQRQSGGGCCGGGGGGGS